MDNYQFTEQERKFAEEYLVDLNYVEAYKRAGFKRSTSLQAYQLLRKPGMRDYIKELWRKQKKAVCDE